jgi:hypothetical protein
MVMASSTATNGKVVVLTDELDGTSEALGLGMVTGTETAEVE